MRCPQCQTSYPNTWSICPQCNVKLTPFSTNRLTQQSEPTTQGDPSRMTVDLTGQEGASPPATSPLEEYLTPSRRRRWPIVIGALVGLAVVLGWWLSQGLQLTTNTESPPTALAGDVADEPISDELVQFITRSLESNFITSSANPLLNPAERRVLVSQALADLRDPTVRQNILHNHQTMGQKMKQQGGGKKAWYDHIAVCKKVCNLAFSALTERHFAEVSQRVHQIVVFRTGSSQLDSSSRRDVRLFADLLSNPTYQDRHLLLIGRASRLGAHGYNMMLSERRVHAVKHELQHLRVKPERIKEFWLGWEPPDLTREIADLYRLSPYLFDDDEIQLNQSVVMVLY